MFKRTQVAVFLLSLGAVLPAQAQSTASEDTLKLTHQTLVNAVNSGNLTILEGLIHPNAMGFFQDSQMVAALRHGFGPREALAPVVADISRFVSTQYQADYRVVGSTGLVCLTSAVKDPKGATEYLRVTYVYVFQGENWRLVSWHSSQVPLKR